MRILVLTNHYPPHGYGGYELCCRDVVDRCRKVAPELREIAPGRTVRCHFPKGFQ